MKDDDRAQIMARLPKKLAKDFKKYLLEDDLTIQEFIEEAVLEYLEKNKAPIEGFKEELALFRSPESASNQTGKSIDPSDPTAGFETSRKDAKIPLTQREKSADVIKKKTSGEK